jgi:hypothetical protein
MAKYFVFLALFVSFAYGQNGADRPLTNETVIKMVASGVPAETVIMTIRAASSVSFGFLPGDLDLLQRYHVPDDVVKAMSAKSSGRPIPQPSAPSPQASPQQPSAPRLEPATPPLPVAPVVSPADQQPANPGPTTRIFVTDSNSWEISGGFAAASNRNGSAASGRFAGGARPQTVEIIKTFNERCPSATVTMDKAQAQFIVLLDHEGGKGYVRKDNKIAVFRAGGDLLFSDSTRSLGNAVEDACAAIFR